jgi:hypothetical protein
MECGSQKPSQVSVGVPTVSSHCALAFMRRRNRTDCLQQNGLLTCQPGALPHCAVSVQMPALNKPRGLAPFAQRFWLHKNMNDFDSRYTNRWLAHSPLAYMCGL